MRRRILIVVLIALVFAIGLWIRLGSYLDFNLGKGGQFFGIAKSGDVANEQSTDLWKIEDASLRNALPEFKTIQAAKLAERTPTSAGLDVHDFNNWHRSNGNSGSTRYSALDQINKTNVKMLRKAWEYRSGDGFAPIQCNPIFANGLIFTAMGKRSVVAVRASDGREQWRFQAPADLPARRGLIWWSGKNQTAPRIYFPAGDSLVALDAATGKPVVEFGKLGFAKSSNSTVAPAIWENVILNANLSPGVDAFDVVTGKLLWRYNILIQQEKHLPNGRRFNLSGGNPWGGFSVDEQRGIAYIATGNPSPGNSGIERPGQNKNSDSVIALDIKSGKELWAFQEVGHDLWDLDIPAPPILATITLDDKKIDVVVATTKLGNTIILDRISGKPIFDFRLRRSPVSNVAGEQTWPYQPSVEIPEPFAKQEFKVSDITDLGEKNKRSISDQIKNAKFGFFQPPEPDAPVVLFGLTGGAEWAGGALDVASSTLFVSSNEIPWVIELISEPDLQSELSLSESPGRRVYVEKCAQCHGKFRVEGLGPSLKWIGKRVSKLGVKTVVHNGLRSMPPVVGLNEQDLNVLIDYLFSIDSKLANLASRPAEQVKSKADANKLGIPYFIYRRLIDNEGYPGSKPPWGTLNSIDLNTGKRKWSVPFGEYSELTKRGLRPTGMENRGGPIVTKGGLIFISGTPDKMLRAFDKDTGEILWKFKLKAGSYAPPMTFEFKGEQYLIVHDTGGNTIDFIPPANDALIAFKLN